jgi:cytochrome c-type biogenesis protein CcmH
MRRWLLGLALVVAVLAAPALAVQPGEELADPALEARARSLSREIRCLVCQNQSIEESEADLARDLRLILRERLAAGDSDAEVKQYLVERYGDFVLLDPPVKAKTFLLWFGPAVILLLAFGGAWLYLRRWPVRADAPELTPAERAELDRLLAGPEGEERAGS